jgi:HSP20 family molecular chaperone IbpA
MRNMTHAELLKLKKNAYPVIFDDVDSLIEEAQVQSGNITVAQDSQNVYIEAALPGVAADDIEVTHDRGALWIKGKVREESGKHKSYIRRATRNFSYKISFPADIKTEAAPEVKLHNGIIAMAFPKADTVFSDTRRKTGKNKPTFTH